MLVPELDVSDLAISLHFYAEVLDSTGPSRTRWAWLGKRASGAADARRDARLRQCVEDGVQRISRRKDERHGWRLRRPHVFWGCQRHHGGVPGRLIGLM